MSGPKGDAGIGPESRLGGIGRGLEIGEGEMQVSEVVGVDLPFW